ncbi:hypothetical protein SAMN04488102_11414 [Alkalibacterium subtropicum]|uniref:Uncharacterized protein n=1 Tax=Alkalibacterium subtropicum TaxID=753702 RepID=A0A1I1KUC9_9LACT|nr:hypothetical protein [Alkalibacterium subtropicum]SFC62338.1 hypothetical protein SAMN04488102_11414 [Alkalibacterium subtropicum]
MKNTRSIVSSLLFFSLAVIMFLALSSAVLPAYATHGRSMIIGTLAYIIMSGMVIFSSVNSRGLSIAGALASFTFIGAHTFIEANLFSTIGLASLTNPFGYAAIAAFLLAGATYIMNKVGGSAQLSLYVNGLMTAGITLVYYHVASLAPVRTSVLFFVPFTFLLIWTVVQYGIHVSEAVKTSKQFA